MTTADPMPVLIAAAKALLVAVDQERIARPRVPAAHGVDYNPWLVTVEELGCAKARLQSAINAAESRVAA